MGTHLGTRVFRQGPAGTAALPAAPRITCGGWATSIPPSNRMPPACAAIPGSWAQEMQHEPTVRFPWPGLVQALAGSLAPRPRSCFVARRRCRAGRLPGAFPGRRARSRPIRSRALARGESGLLESWGLAAAVDERWRPTARRHASALLAIVDVPSQAYRPPRGPGYPRRWRGGGCLRPRRLAGHPLIGLLVGKAMSARSSPGCQANRLIALRPGVMVTPWARRRRAVTLRSVEELGVGGEGAADGLRHRQLRASLSLWRTLPVETVEVPSTAATWCGSAPAWAGPGRYPRRPARPRRRPRRSQPRGVGAGAPAAARAVVNSGASRGHREQLTAGLQPAARSL